MGDLGRGGFVVGFDKVNACEAAMAPQQPELEKNAHMTSHSQTIPKTKTITPEIQIPE